MAARRAGGDVASFEHVEEKPEIDEVEVHGSQNLQGNAQPQSVPEAGSVYASFANRLHGGRITA